MSLIGARTMEDHDRLVGADRVLAVLMELAHHPGGVGLDELAQRIDASKPTVHRALTTLRRAKLATQLSRGRYELGDEFLRLAFLHQAARPESARIEPTLRRLADHYGETTHYAVLDGIEVVYRAKVDPPAGSVRLTSQVGGRNPAYRTAVGKMLLSERIESESALREWLRDSPIEPRTPNSIVTIEELWAELDRTRARGYAVDDQENEIGINCVAIPLPTGPLMGAGGAISISALAFRLPLARLEKEVPTIRSMIEATLLETSPHG